MEDAWLLTGAGGFAGRWVRAALDSGEVPGGARVVALPGDIDLRDRIGLRDWIASIRPRTVIHLAAQTHVRESFDDPDASYDVNFRGTLNLLHALKSAGFSGRMLYVGSGDMYGDVPETALPIVETQPLRPRSPYAVSKVAAEAACYQSSVSDGFDVVMARPFNHIGPGQSERFVVSSLARQVAEIQLGRAAPVVHVGNLEATRDFTDVRDVAQAYIELSTRGVSGEIYNVCSGVEQSIRSMLERLIDLSGSPIEVRQDPARMRASEQLRSCGSFVKLNDLTGWRPRYAIDQTLRDILADWQQRLQQ
jgi:GDP-4-dehydro-6-deoxy-D-mannose reductase